MKFEDPETGDVVRETVEVPMINSKKEFEIFDDFPQVNLTKPEKRKVERKAKAHFDHPHVGEEEQVDPHMIFVTSTPADLVERQFQSVEKFHVGPKNCTCL